MAANYGKLDPLQAEKVWALHLAGHSGAKISRMLAVGFPRDDPAIAPVKITVQSVNEHIRRCRAEWQELEAAKVATVPTQANADLLRARLMRIAHREADRLSERQSAGKLDPDQLRKLVGAVKALESLEEAAENRRKRGKPRGKAPVAAPPPEPSTSVIGALLRKGDGSEADPEQSGIASGPAPVVP